MKPFTGSNEGKTLNVTLSSPLRHEIEIVSVPHVRFWDDFAVVDLKTKGELFVQPWLFWKPDGVQVCSFGKVFCKYECVCLRTWK